MYCSESFAYSAAQAIKDHRPSRHADDELRLYGRWRSGRSVAELTISGLRTLIENEDGLTFGGETAEGLAAVATVRELRPDVVLMDIRIEEKLPR